MDKFKEKMALVRGELDAKLAKAEAAEMEVKRLTDENAARDDEITSLRTKVQYAEDKILECEARIEDAKSGLDAGETAKVTGEGLSRKVALLEVELENVERNLAEANEKLRQMDSKAELFERKSQQLEAENTSSESKVDELVIQYNTAKADLEATYQGIHDL
ncbi:MAG: actin lateral binding protein [Linnemannia elongata]|nr:MAG: actin lateral binding protein [Linnemannia elongata]